MREFFKGWRRKAGCVTLMIAIVEWVAIAQPNVIRTDGTEIETAFLTLLSAVLILWPRKRVTKQSVPE